MSDKLKDFVTLVAVIQCDLESQLAARKPAPRRYDVAIQGVPEAQAYALAELCKRIGWTDVRANAVDDAEARNMLAAMNRVRGALEQVGVHVR